MFLGFLDLNAVSLSFFELGHRFAQYVVDAGLPAWAGGFECLTQVGIDAHIECGSLLSQRGSTASAFDLRLVPKNINLTGVISVVGFKFFVHGQGSVGGHIPPYPGPVSGV
jgi:hypothetical protein